MDAANPLSRWLMAVGLAAAIGCASTAADRKFSDERLSESEKNTPGWKEFHERQARDAGVGRGQLPDPVAPRPPAPGAPVTPGAPGAPGAPVVPGSPLGPVSPVGSPVGGTPVAGRPVQPGTGDPNVQTASLSGAPKADPLKDSVPQIKVVAYVGATGLVTDQEVVEAVRQRPDLAGLDGHARAAKEKELYAMMLRKTIERELVLDDMYAKLKKGGKAGMVDEIKEFASKGADQNLRGIRRELGLMEEEKFQLWLRVQGLSEPVIRRQMERQTMADEYIRSALREKGRGPGLAEIRAYYESHPAEFKSEDRVKWLDIFVNANKHATMRAAYDHAEAIRKQAATPGTDFVALSKQHDDGVAKGTNGVGIGSKRNEIQPADVEPSVWALKPGEVSQVIQTPVGYHIVKVVERDVAGPRPFDAKVQGEIREKLVRVAREAEYKRVVEDLWRNGAVRVIPEQ
jgi:peptidyl-prolyl cis-trans isomerase SurA